MPAGAHVEFITVPRTADVLTVAARLIEGAHDGQFKMPQLTGDTAFQENFRIEEEIFIEEIKK